LSNFEDVNHIVANETDSETKGMNSMEGRGDLFLLLAPSVHLIYPI